MINMENITIFKVKVVTSIAGYVFVLISLLLLVVLITRWRIDEPNEIYWVFGMFVFYFSFGMPLVVLSLKYKLVLSEGKITQIYPFKKTVVFDWAEIESINFRISNGSISIQGNGKRIKLSRSIGNINNAFSMILKKVGKDKILFDN